MTEPAGFYLVILSRIAFKLLFDSAVIRQDKIECPNQVVHNILGSVLEKALHVSSFALNLNGL